MLSLIPRFSPWPVPRPPMLGVGPGPQVLAAGNLNLGWYGEVSAAELISGDALATQVGLTSGTAINSTAGWLKFSHLGKTLFVAKRAFRHSILLQSLADANIEFGTRHVIIGPYEFKIRLIKGGNANPATVIGGEWNDLIYRVSENDPTNTFWALNTNNDLGLIVDTNPGCNTTCQETRNFEPYTGERLTRGGYSTPLTGNWAQLAGATNSYYGWRPVLEYVGMVEAEYDPELWLQYSFLDNEPINEVTETFAALENNAIITDNKLVTVTASDVLSSPGIVMDTSAWSIETRFNYVSTSANMGLIGVWNGNGNAATRWYLL